MLTEASRLRDFPAFAGQTYLNTAAEGIPPLPVIEALNQYGQDALLGFDGRVRHDVQRDAALHETAQALNLGDEDVGICSCVSEAYNLAALALRLSGGDQVIINDLDFPAGTTPWLAESCPAEVRLWQSRQGALRIEDLVPLISPQTRLLTVSLVSFYNGHMVRLSAIAEALRKHSDALLAVDVTQALGRIPLDLDDADLIVSATHKWILAVHGGGLVGVPPHRRDRWTVPAGGWHNQVNAFDSDRFERAVPKPGAASFCVGMPGYPAVYAARAGMQYIRTTGVEAIDAHARPLVRACLDGLKKLPVELLTPDEQDALAGIVAFRHPDAGRITAALRAADIHVMHQAGRMRVAIHGYNTMQDIEKLLDGLGEAM